MHAMQTTPKSRGAGCLTSDRISLKGKNVTRHRRQFAMMKGTVLQDVRELPTSRHLTTEPQNTRREIRRYFEMNESNKCNRPKFTGCS